MKTLLYNVVIVGEKDLFDQTAVVIENGIIKEFVSSPNPTDYDQAIDCFGNYLLPGFIDVHVHGGGGSDFMDGTVDAMHNAILTHLRHGTTTIFPTTMSADHSEIACAIENLRNFKKAYPNLNIGGLHLEGPFLSPLMCGAQRPDLIKPPTADDIEFLKNNSDVISRITCAPEVENVIQMAKELLPLNISFSMGHTMATYEQAEHACENGFNAVTHLYSATSGFHKVNQKVHVGVTQAGYGIDGLYVELIGDGCHVPKELLRLVVKLKDNDKICLVTDAMRAAGTDVSESYLGRVCPENRVIIDDGVAKLPDKSFFAGSIGTMDRAFKFTVEKAGLSLSLASKLVSLNPAKLMGIDDKKGSISIGKDADLVIMDKNLSVVNVFINGSSFAE